MALSINQRLCNIVTKNNSYSTTNPWIFRLKLKIRQTMLHNKFQHAHCVINNLRENKTNDKLNFYALGNKMIRLVLFDSLYSNCFIKTNTYHFLTYASLCSRHKNHWHKAWLVFTNKLPLESSFMAIHNEIM